MTCQELRTRSRSEISVDRSGPSGLKSALDFDKADSKPLRARVLHEHSIARSKRTCNRKPASTVSLWWPRLQSSSVEPFEISRSEA